MSTEKGSLIWLGQLLWSFSEGNIDGLERNQECSVARAISRFLPVCAYQWAQILMSVAASLWICVFWSEAILLALTECNLIPPQGPSSVMSPQYLF